MHPYPHVYRVKATGGVAGAVPVAAAGLPDLSTAPPPEFDGPGDVWSPETLLVAAVANCFVFTFRGVSRAAKFDWQDLQCEVAGTLEKVERVTRFSKFVTQARLTVPAGADVAKARQLLERAEQLCLVANSLVAPRHLEIEVVEAP